MQTAVVLYTDLTNYEPAATNLGMTVINRRGNRRSTGEQSLEVAYRPRVSLGPFSQKKGLHLFTYILYQVYHSGVLPLTCTTPPG